MKRKNHYKPLKDTNGWHSVYRGRLLWSTMNFQGRPWTFKVNCLFTRSTGSSSWLTPRSTVTFHGWPLGLVFWNFPIYYVRLNYMQYLGWLYEFLLSSSTHLYTSKTIRITNISTIITNQFFNVEHFVRWKHWHICLRLLSIKITSYNWFKSLNSCTYMVRVHNKKSVFVSWKLTIWTKDTLPTTWMSQHYFVYIILHG